MKYNKDIKYEYNLQVSNGGCSIHHPSPNNPGESVKEQEDFYTLHYGKLSKSYLDGSGHSIRAKWDANGGKGSFEYRLSWHLEHNKTDFLETKKTEKIGFGENI